PSCLPVKPIHGAVVPISSSPPSPSGTSTRPPLNERGPRQNSPPYPALGRPCVVGLPNRSVAPAALVIRVANASTQASSCTEIANDLSSSIQWSPRWLTQSSSSARCTTSGEASNRRNDRWRIEPLLGSCW